MTRSYTTHSVEETVQLGAAFARELARGSVVALFGDLGSGKTHLIKGICQGLGVSEHVASPTFTIINEYHTPRADICHADCYRLKTPAELRDVGFEEYLSGGYICLIEWADRVKDLLPPRRYDVTLSLGADPSSREIAIEEIAEVEA